MLLKDLETLCHAFANGHGRYDDDELVPAISFVKLEHRLDVDICLPGTGFHFDVENACAKLRLDKFRGKFDFVSVLHRSEVLQELFGEKHHVGVLLAESSDTEIAQILRVGDRRAKPLSGEDIDDRIDGVCLILLNAELELHSFKSPCTRCSAHTS